MSTAGTLVAGWQKSNTHIFLTNTMSAPAASTADLAFKNVNSGPWPRQQRPIQKLPYQSSGGAHSMPVISDFQNASVQRPTPSFELPFQSNALALALVSLFQNASGSPAIVCVPPTDPQAKWFFVAETLMGYGRNIVGAVAKSVKISVPAAGADGGNPTLTMDTVGHSSAQIAALTGAGTLDVSMPIHSTDCVWTGIANMGHCGFDLTFDNGAEVDPQVSAAPAGVELGTLAISGNINVVLSSTATDEYKVIYDLWNGSGGAVPTPSALVLTITFPNAVTCTMNIPAVWDEPSEPKAQGNIQVVSMPFSSYYVDATHPQVTFSAGYTSLIGTNLWTA